MMLGFVSSLVVASIAGTLIWIVQSSIKPVTHKLFSQAWHYYTGLIPAFFLLGGSEIINRLVSFIRSVSSSDKGTIPEMGTIAEQYAHVTPIEQMRTSRRPLVDFLLQFELRLDDLREFAGFAAVIWAVGTLVFFLVHIQRYRSFKRSVLLKSRICETIQCPAKVIVSANVTTPMVMGLRKPIVVLPDIRYGEKELAMILSHELVHLERGDLLVKFLLLIANAVHWFNPAVYSLNKQLHMLCELSCDEKVVQDMDTKNRRYYGETLLSTLEYGVMQKKIVFTSGLCNPKEAMKRRLMNLMNEKKMKKPTLVLSLVAAIALVGSGGAAAYAAESAVPTRTAVPIVIPTGKQIEGQNIYVQSPDGTTVYYDRDGNVSPVLSNPKEAKQSAVPTRTAVPINIPTGKQIEGQNIYVQSPDGTTVYYDRDGNVSPVISSPKKAKQFDKKTQEKIDKLHDKIKSYIDKGLPVPKKITDAYTPDELGAALNGIGPYVYDEKNGIRPYPAEQE